MVLKTLQNNLLLSEDIKTVSYDFWVTQHIKSTESVVKNEIKAEVQKTFVKKDELGYLFSVEVDQRSQSNREGALGIDDAISFLQKSVTLYTNIHGEIIKVVNTGQIKEDWDRAYKTMDTDLDQLPSEKDAFLKGIDALLSDNVSFVSFLQKSELYTMLFPPIYGHDILEKRVINQKKSFDNFFDTTTLPVQLETSLIGVNPETKGKQVVRSGYLDTYRFDKMSAAKMFTEVYGIHESATGFKTNYLETYDLLHDNSVDKCTTMMDVTVKDLYNYRHISKLIKKNV